MDQVNFLANRFGQVREGSVRSMHEANAGLMDDAVGLGEPVHKGRVKDRVGAVTEAASTRLDSHGDARNAMDGRLAANNKRSDRYGLVFRQEHHIEEIAERPLDRRSADAFQAPLHATGQMVLPDDL